MISKRAPFAKVGVRHHVCSKVAVGQGIWFAAVERCLLALSTVQGL